MADQHVGLGAQAARGVEHGVFDRVQAQPQDVAICVIGLRMAYAVRPTVSCCSGVSTGDATTLIFTPFADVTLS
ncbi:hypothetical protein ACL58G_25245 [Massilia sp. GER05]|uniref:hypothetical protein n=1 Tax=unclassified Massilia TaxID=2609279 RepID=UPI0039AFC5A1